MLPIDILREYLKQIEETQLLELLNVNSEELVEAFGHKIRERRAYLNKEVELMQEIDVSQAEDYVDADMEEDDY